MVMVQVSVRPRRNQLGGLRRLLIEGTSGEYIDLFSKCFSGAVEEAVYRNGQGQMMRYRAKDLAMTIGLRRRRPRTYSPR